MSITNLQSKPVVIGAPIEIESAVNEIRLALAAGLPWVTNPYFIAQKFLKKEPGGQTFIYPETYAPTKPGLYDYHRLTPDNDYKGMFFFMVGPGENNFRAGQKNFLTHNVSIIFSVNLKLIDPVKLNAGLFTQELIRDARRVLTSQAINFVFSYNILNETRDLQECFQEFIIDDLEQYNRAPMQCFRFNLELTVQEDCI